MQVASSTACNTCSDKLLGSCGPLPLLQRSSKSRHCPVAEADTSQVGALHNICVFK